MIYGITKIHPLHPHWETNDRRIWSWGVDDWLTSLAKALAHFLPEQNPDHEPLYQKVDSWAIELDDDWWPQREVALDSCGRPLFRSPNARNVGYWTKSVKDQFNSDLITPITKEEFDQSWSSLEKKPKKTLKSLWPF